MCIVQRSKGGNTPSTEIQIPNENIYTIIENPDSIEAQPEVRIDDNYRGITSPTSFQGNERDLSFPDFTHNGFQYPQSINESQIITSEIGSETFFTSLNNTQINDLIQEAQEHGINIIYSETGLALPEGSQAGLVENTLIIRGIEPLTAKIREIEHDFPMLPEEAINFMAENLLNLENNPNTEIPITQRFGEYVVWIGEEADGQRGGDIFRYRPQDREYYRENNSSGYRTELDFQTNQLWNRRMYYLVEELGYSPDDARTFINQTARDSNIWMMMIAADIHFTELAENTTLFSNQGTLGYNNSRDVNREESWNRAMQLYPTD